MKLCSELFRSSTNPDQTWKKVGSRAQNRDYFAPVGTFDVLVSTDAIFLASKPEPAQ